MSENQLEWIKDLSEQNSEYKTEKYIDALMNVRKYYKQVSLFFFFVFNSLEFENSIL